MANTLNHLGTWSAGLRLEQIPKDVLRRAQLQHLSTAGAIRAVSSWDAPLSGPKAAVWAGRSALLDNTDHLFWGQTSQGAVCATWAETKGQKAVDLLVATVAANEIGGRFGAATSLCGDSGQACLWIHSLCAAVAIARRLGLDGVQSAHAMAIALAESPAPRARFSQLAHTQRAAIVAQSVRAGMEAAESASQGLLGELDLLDRQDGPIQSLSGKALMKAFTGLGTCWLGRSTAYSLSPGHLFSKVPVQAVHEVLRRHVRAADRRLRVDQVDRIEIKTHALSMALAAVEVDDNLDPAAFCADIRQQIGLLVATHELGAQQFHPEVLQTHQAAIAHVAARVHLEHDWCATLQLTAQLRESMAPLYGDLKPQGLWRHFASGSKALGWKPGLPPADQWVALLKQRPDRLFKKSNGVSDLSQVDDLAFRYPFPTEVKLFTTRGGWWPERRDTPEGAPGWDWQATVEGVAKKWACGESGADQKAMALFEAPLRGAASTWVRNLGV
jgi:hypothetical protein